MATWQYDVFLVPIVKLQERGLLTESPIPRDVFEQIDWWAGCQPSPAYRDHLAAHLHKTAGWSPDVEIWGAEAGDRVDVVLEGSAVVEISVRIDTRQIDDAFVTTITELAEICAAAFVDARMVLVERDFDSLSKAIVNSPERRFTLAPRKYLEDL